MRKAGLCGRSPLKDPDVVDESNSDRPTVLEAEMTVTAGGTKVVRTMCPMDLPRPRRCGKATIQPRATKN
jgi:hypothetical protein